MSKLTRSILKVVIDEKVEAGFFRPRSLYKCTLENSILAWQAEHMSQHVSPANFALYLEWN
jgi:hypothetical protein